MSVRGIRDPIPAGHVIGNMGSSPAAAQFIPIKALPGSQRNPAAIPLTSGDVLVGNAGNVAAGVTITGDASITNLGAVKVTKTNGVGFGPLATQAPGLSVTIATAKLTSGGTSGSMTFIDGVLTAQVAAT